MILFIDTKLGRGGGQVVLEELCRQLPDGVDTRVLCDSRLAEQLDLPQSARVYSEISEAIEGLSTDIPIVVVSNANSSLPQTCNAAKKLRRDGYRVLTVAILHNYPRSWLTSIATRFWLSKIDRAVVVEPGLTTLRRDADVPAWLSIQRSQVPSPLSPELISRGRLICFARPDKIKGLDLLPEVFTRMRNLDLCCEVALGASVDDNRRYEKRLRVKLDPWLIEGHRGADWIAPGDIFIIPSKREAACLSAQEAMARGAIVVASRVGLMSYLSPIGNGIRTFREGNAADAVRVVSALLDLAPEEFDAECRQAAQQILGRAGKWYDDVVTLLTKHERLLEHNDMD